MNGGTQRRRARWIRVGLAVAALLAAHSLHGGSAEAATSSPQPHGGALILAARDAPAAPGIVLAGFTSQQYPTFFKVSDNARTLTIGAIALQMTCTSGAQFVLEDAFGAVQISPSGSLHARTSTPPTAGSGGATFSGTDSLKARLNHRHTRMSGTWRLTVNYSFTNGMTDQCESGPVRSTATN